MTAILIDTDDDRYKDDLVLKETSDLISDNIAKTYEVIKKIERLKGQNSDTFINNLKLQDVVITVFSNMSAIILGNLARSLSNSDIILQKEIFECLNRDIYEHNSELFLHFLKANE